MSSTLFQNNFDGQTNGAAVTVANSAASGNAFSHVVLATGGSIVYSSSAGVGGGTGMRITPGSTYSYPRWTAPGTDGRRVVARRSVNVTSTPTANAILLELRTEVSATALLAQLSISTALQVQVSVGSAVIIASRIALPSTGVYWVELAAVSASASGVSDGTVEYRVYAEDGTTLIGSWSSGATQAVSYSWPNIARFSGVGGSIGWTYDDMDDLQALFTDDLNAWLGPIGSTAILPTPVVAVTGHTNPTTSGGTDGTITVTWSPVSGASHYVAGLDTVAGVTVVAEPVTSPYTFTGLAGGTYTPAIQAKA